MVMTYPDLSGYPQIESLETGFSDIITAFSCTFCGSFHLLDCCWRKYQFFLCVFCKLFTSSPISAIIKTFLMNYASAFDLKKKNQRTWVLSSILTWKHTPSYMLFYSSKMVCERMI